MRTICFFNSNIPWGGGEAWHFNAAKSLSERGWHVVLACHPEGELHKRASTLQNVKILRLAVGRLSFLNPLIHKRISTFFNQYQVDTVIMNLPADLKAAAFAAKKAGVKQIIYRRGSALPVKNSALNRFLFGNILTHLIVNSKATRDTVLVNNPHLINPEKITIIPNGLDIADFDAQVTEARETGVSFFPHSAQKDKRPFIIGTAGRLDRQKAQHLLLYLGKLLTDMELDYKILIAGTGEREAELKQLSMDLKIDSNVLFTGFLPNMAQFWADIDLFILTSLWEGFGNVIVEAGLAEKPVFAFDVSNLPELIQDGVNGRLFKLPPSELKNSPRIMLAGQNSNNNPGVTHSEVAPFLPGQKSCSFLEMGPMASSVRELAADKEKASLMGHNGRRLAEQYSQSICMDRLETVLGKQE